MSVFLGIDIGTSGTKTLAIDAEGTILASAMETYPCYLPKPLWSEQDPEDWWQATIRSVRTRWPRRQAQAGRREGDRAVRPDARLGVPRQAATRSSAGRSSGTTSGPPPSAREIEQRVGGRGEPDPAGGQPGPDRLHRPQNPLAAEPRAAAFREDPQGAAAEGRDPPPPDRRVRHRGERRQRHVAAWTWPGGPGRTKLLSRAGTGRRPAGPLLRIGGSDRQAHARRPPSCWACRPIAWWWAGRATARPGPWATASSPAACSPPRSAPPA